MQSLLQQRIAKLERLNAYLTLLLTAAWIGFVTFVQPIEGQSVTTTAWQCALAAALVLIGTFAPRLKAGTKKLFLYTAYFLVFYVSPMNTNTPQLINYIASATIICFALAGFIIDLRIDRLKRHSDARFS